MKKKKAKKIYMTDKMLAELKMEWLVRGKRQARNEIARAVAETLGLYEIFETVKEDY